MPQVYISRLDSSLHVGTRFVLEDASPSERGGSVMIDIDGASTCLSFDDARRLSRTIENVLSIPAAPAPTSHLRQG